jgi:Mn2+/Fe2+ NRAMP family transporter
MDQVLTQILGPLGALVFALFIIFSGFKRWWVFGWQYKEKVRELNEWKDAALRGTRVVERVVTLAENREQHDESI